MICFEGNESAYGEWGKGEKRKENHRDVFKGGRGREECDRGTCRDNQVKYSNRTCTKSSSPSTWSPQSCMYMYMYMYVCAWIIWHSVLLQQLTPPIVMPSWIAINGFLKVPVRAHKVYMDQSFLKVRLLRVSYVHCTQCTCTCTYQMVEGVLFHEESLCQWITFLTSLCHSWGRRRGRKRKRKRGRITFILHKCMHTM